MGSGPSQQPHESSATRVGGALTPCRRELSDRQVAILLSVIYSDLFDYPLTVDELHRYLVAPCPTEADLGVALDGLVGPYLARVDGFVCLAGREALVGLRRQRERTARARWDAAQRYARWLARVPFARMVAVCGSQAAGSPRPDADIDVFVVTESGRLWIVQVCAMLLRRVARLRSMKVCPNYFLAADSLEVEPRDLYHAREVAQVVPLWGASTYARFRDANTWVAHLLPNLGEPSDRLRWLSDTVPSRATRWCERALAGAIGTWLDRLLHESLLVYYPLRLWHLGWRRDQFRRDYARDRQVVIRGGYGPAVTRAFCQRVSARLGDEVARLELPRLFPDRDDTAGPVEPDGLYAHLFATHYGHGRD